MAVTNLTVTALDAGSYRLSWSTTLVTPGVEFYVYRDGVLAKRTALTSYDVSTTDGESPVFEVFDDAGDEPAFAYPDFAYLAWYAAPGTLEYLVEQFVGAAWVGLERVLDDGRGYFLWRSGTLADGATHQFRVTPIGVNGNAGTAKTFNLLMVRTPDVPAVTYAYNAGAGTVTIAAA